jgi:hypothetical protein
MKKYEYIDKRFMLEQTLTNVFAILIIFIAAYYALKGVVPVIMTLAFISAFYSVINNFVFKVNSKKVIIDKNKLSFEAYGKKDTYFIDAIKKIKLKEFPTNGKIYTRITDENNKTHKYWIHTKSFNDGKELFREMMYIEHDKHPDTLKAKSRDAEFSKERKK